MGHEECEALAALVPMVATALLGHDTGSNCYVNANNSVGSSIGDHGIGKDRNTENASVLARVAFRSCTLENDTGHEGEGMAKEGFFLKWLCNFLKQKTSCLRSKVGEIFTLVVHIDLELFYI